MAVTTLFALLVLAFTARPAHAQTMAFDEHRQTVVPAVSEFTTSINRYLELHRLLESPTASLLNGADLEQTARAREAHRRAIIEARVATPRGDVFTPTVAAYVRRQFQIAAHHAPTRDADVKETAIQRLPRLPNELAYRFVDRDLVLLDTEIDVVVDILENALPPDAPVKGSPCDAHPELEMCWS